MLKWIKISCLCVCVIALASAAGAQTASPAPTPSPTDEFNADTSRDDVLILANITAKELRFDAVPNVKVDFPGTQKRTNIWVTQRQNLPDKVEPGVTYRDVGLQLRISTRFADIEQIVRDELRDSGASGSVNSIPVTSDAAVSKVNVSDQKPRTDKPRPRKRQ
jgi:autonomous glycyl radical cofactor GrcA